MKVFLTVGTHEQPFSRMVELADRLAAAGHETTIQFGFSAPPSAAAGFDFASSEELGRRMAGADAVVTHGGPASVLQALEAGRSPVVLPRSPAHREHVDDHQTVFAAHMARQGLVRVAISIEQAEDLLREAQPVSEALVRRRGLVERNRFTLAESLDQWLSSTGPRRHRGERGTSRR